MEGLIDAERATVAVEHPLQIALRVSRRGAQPPPFEALRRIDPDRVLGLVNAADRIAARVELRFEQPLEGAAIGVRRIGDSRGIVRRR